MWKEDEKLLLCSRSKISNMKIKEILVLFCMAMLCFSSPAYTSVLANTSPPVQLQESIEDEAAQEHLGDSNIIAGSSKTQEMKYGHGTVGHRGGGNGGSQAGGGGGEGNNNGGGSSDTHGGSTAVPIYAGGAEHNRRNNNHHNAGSSTWSHEGWPSISVIILASFLANLRHVLWF